jgi:ABC-2 type transport system permease protein
LTHFIRLIRGVILRGASLQELSGELLVLGGFIVVLMSLAILRFSKRLD